MKKWYSASTSGNQGLIVEEETGRNVAVTYDEDDAALVAAAPDMLDALKAVRDNYQNMFDYMPIAWQTIDDIVNAVIAQAEGRGQ